MATLTPSPKQQFFDANGNPLSGGKLYTYAAGTTTPLATYTDSSGTVANSNPVILDSRGEASIWLGNLFYKFKLTTSANVEIWTVDNISSSSSAQSSVSYSSQYIIATSGQITFSITSGFVPGSNSLAVYQNGARLINQVDYFEIDANTVSFVIGATAGDIFQFVTATEINPYLADASGVGYQPGGTGAVSTNVQTKLRESISVKDFGAVGDGITDDTAFIQNAINAVISAGGGDLYFPEGKYLHSGLTVNWTNSPIRLYGSSYNSQSGYGSELYYSGSSVALTFEGNGAAFNGYVIENLRISASTTANHWAIKFNKCSFPRVEHCYISGFGNAYGGGIYFTGLNNSVDQTEWVTVKDVYFAGCFNGIYSDNTDCNDFTIAECFFSGGAGASIRGDNGGGAHTFGFQRWNILDNRFYTGSSVTLIDLKGGARGLVVDGNYFESALSEVVCLYVNGALKSTGIQFSNNNVTRQPPSGRGVVEIGYCDGVNIFSNTYTPVSTGTRSMLQLVDAAVDNFQVERPRFPVSSALPNTLRTFGGTAYTVDLVTNRSSVQLISSAVTCGRAIATQNPTTEWGLNLYGHGFLSIASGATSDIAVGSGVVIIHSDTSQNAAMFLCYGAGTAIKIAGHVSIVSGAPASGQIGFYYNAGTGKYRIENQKVFTEFLNVSLQKTNNNS